MLKIISAKDLKTLEDSYITESGILSYELMEAAAEAFCQWYTSKFDRKKTICVMCGYGNNGGDGLAIARILFRQGYPVCVYKVGDFSKATPDLKSNLRILPTNIVNKNIDDIDKEEFECDIIIDSIFGFGLNRPVDGVFKEAIQFINEKEAYKISVDIPSGLPADGLLVGEAVQADFTVSFHFPKLSLLFPEHSPYVGNLEILDIGIDKKYFEPYDSKQYFIETKDITERHRKFHRASHKGDYGRILMVGGSNGKLGAIMMSAQAALRTGSGLVSAFVPKFGLKPFQTNVPEIMVETSNGEDFLEDMLPGFEKFDAIGVGPGMGSQPATVEALKILLKEFPGKMVIDADALNIIATNEDLRGMMRENMILTPHIREFERMVGGCEDHHIRIEKAREFTAQYNCTLILKGANTMITLPNGTQYFNPTGTHYLATGGTGDVLTGMVTSLLGQGYSVENAALCGVYHHGLAGELASEHKRRGTIASDVIKCIPKTFDQLNIP
jgi:ADP-dependent NAD(P)H-hydrate dehydratase / NAD(P)H-hydrate epimerase